MFPLKLIRAIVHNDHQMIIFFQCRKKSVLILRPIYVFLKMKLTFWALPDRIRIAWKSGRKLILKFSPQADFNFVQPWPMMYIKISIWSGFEIKNWIEDQFQSSPTLVRIWTVLRCIFVLNLEIVTSIGGELWHAQAQNGVNFDFGV